MTTIKSPNGRVIFLDVDGVLNAFDKFDMITTFPAPGMVSPLVVDRNRVATFNHILKQVPFISVVVSSTWRHSNPKQDYIINNCKDFAKVTGLDRTIFHKDWRTPLFGEGENRGKEVRQWMADHPEVFKAVVIDDQYSDQFKDDRTIKYVRTDPRTGFSFNNLYKLMNAFGLRLTKDYRVTTAGGPIAL